jgi:ribosomal protein S18 acetylase RimI-like enzyme
MSVVWLAGPGEVGVVAELLARFRDHMEHDEPDTASLTASVQRLIDDPATEYLLAATATGQRPAGVCQLRYRPSVWTGAEDCWLEDLFVSAGARRHGLGAALVHEAQARARARGCRRIELDTAEDNQNAIRLYERWGFSTTSKGTARSLFLGARLDA